MSGFRLRAPRAASDRAHLVVVLGLVALTFVQRPGQTTFDTKFDLTADPGAFLERTLHLWNPELSFGELQNQAYGYLFPQGTFFLGGDLLGIPDWVVQRAWSALILIAAYDGARRLMRAWAADDAGVRVTGARAWLPLVAGLAYALSPRLLGLSGVLTAEILPTAVLPWAVLPLVLALRGRLSPRAGGLLSGVAVLFMGGVNAVEVLAALPLPALVLLWSWRTELGRRLSLWWAAAVALACSWWLLPLLVLGRYSPPFLDYIETSRATTHPLGWVNATRGADHWLAFINVGGQPWWPGAYDLATTPHLIALTAVVAALSLAGLFHPAMPARGPLAASALLGLVLLTVAHVATGGSPLSEQVRTLLDGPLAPLRNVHKVDPLVRLPLALGLAHGTGVLLDRLSRTAGARARLTRLAPRAVVGAVVVLLLLSAQPLFERNLRKPGWDAVPQAWFQATDYLAEHADGRRTLVLPGTGFGQQTWGWTIDEPIQGLASTPWVTRSQVPLVPGPTIRFLDSIEDRIADGRGSPALADVLARSGIGYVLVRRDLDRFASGAPAPARVDQAVARSRGLEKVASFGRTGLGDQAAISVYAVRRTVEVVEAVDAASVAQVAGGPEDVLTLLEAGVLGARQPAVFDAKQTPSLVGDGYRRRERQFGRLRDSLSQLMTPAESYRNDRRAHDYPGVAGMRRGYAQYPEISALSASSSSGYADTLGAVRPELGPYAAVDGLTGTYWRSAPLENPRGQWLQVRLKQPQPLTRIDLTLGVDGYSGVPVRRVRVQAGDQVSEHPVDPATGAVRVELSGTPVDSVRVTVLATDGDPETGVVAIREITFPGLRLGRSLVVPDAGAGASTDFVFRAEPERRACVRDDLGRSCEADAARPSEEEAGLDRTFRTNGSGTWRLSGTVVARSAPETATLLWPLGGQVRVGASSTLVDDPAVAAQFAVDGDPGTEWLSARGDLAPSLVLSWRGTRTLDRLQVRPASSESRSPGRAVIEAGGQRREVDLQAGSLGFFAPLRAQRVTITFPMPKVPGAETLPVGIGDLVVGGLERLVYAPDPAARTGAQCGLGPTVTLDGRTVRTRVTGTIADVLSGAPMRWESCDPPVRFTPGTHHLDVPATSRFAATTLTLAARSASSSAAHPDRSTEIRRWDSNTRTVLVGPGRAALLRIPENVNGGWRATLNGRTLTPTAVDGWQQAYAVPAGAGGLVTLTYRPDRPYRLLLLLGGLGAVLLAAGAVTVLVRERGRAPSAPLASSRPVRRSHSRGHRAALGGLVVAASWLAGGVPFALGALLALVLGRRPGLVRYAAVAAVAVSGVAAAVVTGLDPHRSLAVPDGLTGAALGMLLVALVSPRIDTTGEA